MLGLHRALGPFLGVISNNHLVCGILYHILDKASLYVLAFELGYYAFGENPWILQGLFGVLSQV
jgi:hypothetical protein